MSDDGQLRDLLHALLRQQTAMLELQRVLVERMTLTPARTAPEPPPGAASHSRDETLVLPEDARPHSATPACTAPEPLDGSASRSREEPLVMPEDVRPRTAAPRDVGPPTASRGAHYYRALQTTPPGASITPEALELRRRLQEVRGAGDLILQFGPHKGTTLGQVALHHPDYLRKLMLGARRPAVRAAAGQLVAVLEAAAEHQRRVSGLSAPGSRSRRSAARR